VSEDRDFSPGWFFYALVGGILGAIVVGLIVYFLLPKKEGSAVFFKESSNEVVLENVEECEVVEDHLGDLKKIIIHRRVKRR